MSAATIGPRGETAPSSTFSAIFSQFLSFSIPLIIIGCVDSRAIVTWGRGAGKWLGITTATAHGSTPSLNAS